MIMSVIVGGVAGRTVKSVREGLEGRGGGSKEGGLFTLDEEVSLLKGELVVLEDKNVRCVAVFLF